MKPFYAFVLMVAATARAADAEEKTPVYLSYEFSRKICKQGGVDCKKSLTAAVDAVVAVQGASGTSKQLYASIDGTCASATCGFIMTLTREILSGLFKKRINCKSPTCNAAAKGITKVISSFEDNYNHNIAAQTRGAPSPKLNLAGSYRDLAKEVCAADSPTCRNAGRTLGGWASDLFRNPPQWTLDDSCRGEGEVCSGISCCDPFFCLRPEGVNDGPRYCRRGDGCKMPGGYCGKSADCCGGFVCKKQAGHPDGVCK